jgi:type II secretory pathway pseudopilin PulG
MKLKHTPHVGSVSDFTLMELLIAVAIMMVIPAMAILGVTRARAAANEATAMGSLHAVNESQTSYAASCGLGFYAPSLATLATAPITTPGDGFISNDLSTDPSTKSSYVITMTPRAIAPGSGASCNGVAAGTLVWTWFASADPLPAGGARFFAGNQGGTLYSGTASLPVTQNGQPAGSQTVQ